MIEWHEKDVLAKEALFFSEFKGTDIVPEFKIEVKGNAYVLKTHKYPYTWGEYSETHDMTKYKPRLAELISKIHDRGILHLDLHSENIVIDPSKDDIRIIDFGESLTMADLGIEPDDISGVIDKCKKIDYDILTE
jgi:serine/threonine protein kinase